MTEKIDTWFGWDANVPPQHGREQMTELPVVKYPGSIGIGFMVQGLPTGMAVVPDLFGRCVIPDDMEVVVRRDGDCVEVVTRPRVLA